MSTCSANQLHRHQAHDRGCGPRYDGLTPELRASIALPVLAKALASFPFPTLPTTTPSSRPLRFLPSRTTTASTSVRPSARRVNVYVCPEWPPQMLESVVVITTRFGSD